MCKLIFFWIWFIRIIKIFFFISFLFILFSGCSSEPSYSEDVKTLTQELLDAACDNKMKQDYEKTIRDQQTVLSEEQLKNSIMNMKNTINCKE